VHDDIAVVKCACVRRLHWENERLQILGTILSNPIRDCCSRSAFEILHFEKIKMNLSHNCTWDIWGCEFGK
jgi:hypothetical protein